MRIFFDLQKPFDSVSHESLLSKLDHYGIRRSAHKLMQSFLYRKQFDCINGISSVIERVTYGVAQESTLGSLLFLLYISELPSSTNCLLRLFADDTCFVINSPELSTLENVMNKDLANVYNWLQANNFHLNPAKSNYLIVTPKTNPAPFQVYLTFSDTEIPYSNNVKYLGVQINTKLNFQAHIRATEQRISKSIGIISKLKYFFSTCAPLKLYYAFVHLQVLNTLVVWGSTYPTYLKNLSVLQNKAVWLLGGAPIKTMLLLFIQLLKYQTFMIYLNMQSQKLYFVIFEITFLS